MPTYLEKLKTDPRVREISDEGRGQGSDGIWVTLVPGLRCSNMETHTVHEWTIADLRKAMSGVEKCDCDACARALEASTIRYRNAVRSQYASMGGQRAQRNEARAAHFRSQLIAAGIPVPSQQDCMQRGVVGGDGSL